MQFTKWDLILLLLFATFSADADINREDMAVNEFSVVNEGRMASHRVLLYLEDITLGECCNYCVLHLNCSSVSYSSIARLCELNDMEFKAKELDSQAEGWHNFATPPAVAGGWSSWTTDMTCSNNCDGVLKYRRKCDDPRPQHGGAKCVGENHKIEKCDTQKCETCYGARDDAYGNITAPKSGHLKAIKLIHVSGEVNCGADPGYWGCTHNSVQKFLVIITDSKKNIVFPEPSILEKTDHGRIYTIAGKNVRDNELKLYNEIGVAIQEGESLMVWDSQDLSDVSEYNNSGKHCIKVEFVYK